MTTIQRTLTLVQEYNIVARGFNLPLASETLSDEVLAQAIAHGLQQTIADAASAAASGHYETNRLEGAPDWKALSADERKRHATNNAMAVAEYGKLLMEKRIAALQAGEWTTRAPGAPGMSALEAMAVTVADEAMSPAKWKAVLTGWDDMTPTRRKNAKLAWLQDDDARWSKVKKAAQRRLDEGPVDLGL